MGLMDRMVSSAFQKQDSALKSTVEVLGRQNEEIIRCLNWVMKATQKLCDTYNVVLDDPLTLDEVKDVKTKVVQGADK